MKIQTALSAILFSSIALTSAETALADSVNDPRDLIQVIRTQEESEKVRSEKRKAKKQQLIAAEKQAKREQKNKTATGNEGKGSVAGEEVRQSLRNLAELINQGDAEKLISLFNSNATFINQDGESFQGKGQLQTYFTSAFKNRAADEISIHLETVTFPAPNVAVATGEISRKTFEAELPTSKISVVLVKEDVNWFISEATETIIQTIHPHDRLLELSWMVGKWKIEKPGESGTVDIKWAENHKFIEARTVFKQPDSTELIDKQIIGWDPKANSLVSWHFDSDGGFGYGKWSHDGDQWALNFAGISSQGRSTLAKNLFTRLNPNEFNWQSTEQSSDGEPINDTDVMHVVRLSKN